MNHSPIRAIVSFWLIVCMLCSLIPLGCHSVKLRHEPGWTERPYVPEMTAQRLQECVEILEDSIGPGRYSVDAKVKVDDDGRVVDVTTNGAPNPDVGTCMRIALRDMTVSKQAIASAGLRAQSPPLQTVQAKPNREHVGEVVIITVVTIVFTEVVIETLVVALGITVTASVAAGAAHAVQANAAQARKPQQPDPKKWTDNGGTIQQNADGTTTYTRSDGVSVTYDKDGFPDFTRYRHPTVKDVQIEFSGSYTKDFDRADKAAGITEEMRQREKYTWHHHQDGKTMQLIKRDVHREFFHTGGMSGTRK